MEQDNSISFTSLVASLLLLKRVVTPSLIVNFISELNCRDIYVNDIEDGFDDLLNYVCDDVNNYYVLKEYLNYGTIIYDNITVYDFLISYVDLRVLDFIKLDSKYSLLYYSNYPNIIKGNNCIDGNFDDNVKKINGHLFQRVKRRVNGIKKQFFSEEKISSDI